MRASFMDFNEISFVFMSVAESNANFTKLDETIELISSILMKLALFHPSQWNYLYC